MRLLLRIYIFFLQNSALHSVKTFLHIHSDHFLIANATFTHKKSTDFQFSVLCYIYEYHLFPDIFITKKVISIDV